MPRTLPDHLKRHAPKREDYETQEDYEEARAYFRHRVASSIPRSSPTSSHSRGSHER